MLEIIDYIVIVTYLSFVLFIGWKSSKGNKTSEDYFMAGRSFAWFPIGVSVAATMISANGFVGGPGWAYSEGLFPFMINVAVPLSIFFVMFTTLPVCYNLKLTSIYEYIELRLGPATRLITVFGFFANAVIQIGSMVFVPSLVISFFTGWDIHIIVPIVVLTALGYTLLGGMRAVIWTDVSQMLVMWLSLIFVFFIITDTVPLSEIMQKASTAGKLSSIDLSWNFNNPNTFWATLIGGFVMWVNYFGFNQVQVQRVLTARSIRDAKRSFLSSAVIMNVMYFIFMFIGVMLFVMFEGRKFENANAVMITFVSTHLGKGLVGLVIAGIFASAMSSVDSLFNSMTTVFTKDIYERYISKDGNAASLKTSMTISALFGVLVIAVAILGFSKTVESVLSVVGNYISYISGPMAAIYFLSFFSSSSNDKGVAAGSIAGFISVVIFCSFISVGWIWKPAIGLVFSFTFSYLASMFFKQEDEKKLEYTITAITKKIASSGNVSEGGESLLPCAFDKFSLMTLIFFFLQYVFLFLISK